MLSRGTKPRSEHPQQKHMANRMFVSSSGVAIGSSVGHAIGGLFSGGGSSEPAPAPQQQVQAAPAQQENSWAQQNNCSGAAQSFTQCMDDNNGNMQICNWYLEQLKACQTAAKNY